MELAQRGGGRSYGTSAPDVYACGDCAVYGMSYGLWSETKEMGRVAGVNAAGGDESYQPVVRPLIFHGMGTALFALGDCGKKELPYQVEEVRRDGQYEKYWLVDGRLVGALLLGSIAAMGKVMPAVLDGKGIEASAEQQEYRRCQRSRASSWCAALLCPGYKNSRAGHHGHAR